MLVEQCANVREDVIDIAHSAHTMIATGQITFFWGNDVEATLL